MVSSDTVVIKTWGIKRQGSISDKSVINSARQRIAKSVLQGY